MKKRDKVLMICLISIILFNCFFMIMLIYYNDIIIVANNFFKSVSKEYYLWYLERPIVDNELIIIGVTKILNIVFSVIFLLEFFYIVFSKKYINEIEKKNVILSLLIGFIIYCLSFILIKYRAEHYKLFMILIPTEIFSIILLNLILKVKRVATLQLN
ncbi:hypothetical protein [Alkaliphilus crotonatoxidans]